MMRRALLLLTLLLTLLALGRRWLQRPAPHREEVAVGDLLGGTPDPGFARVTTPPALRFPLDHGPHPGYRTEWWYFTGILHASSGRPFGYQLTFFRFSLTPKPVPRKSRWGTNEVYMAHFTVTDVEGKTFHASERFSRAAVGLAGAGADPLTVHLEEWTATVLPGEPFAADLSASAEGHGVELRLRAETPPMLNGDRGMSRKGRIAGNASGYYSIPRLATTGTIRTGGETFTVTGLSWLDREWGTTELEPDQAGWDWFGLRLDDGRSLMVYRLRRKDGRTDPFSGGTLRGADGTTRSLAAADLELEPRSWWQSPRTGARYPARWRLRLPREGLDLEVVPLLPDQELAVTATYWEGAVAVRGAGASPGGSGYMEMTGYERSSQRFSK